MWITPVWCGEKTHTSRLAIEQTRYRSYMEPGDILQGKVHKLKTSLPDMAFFAMLLRPSRKVSWRLSSSAPKNSIKRAGIAP